MGVFYRGDAVEMMKRHIPAALVSPPKKISPVIPDAPDTPPQPEDV